MIPVVPVYLYLRVGDCHVVGQRCSNFFFSVLSEHLNVTPLSFLLLFLLSGFT